MSRPLMLLDTASMYFRAFHGVPEQVRAPDGSPVNAVRGLLDMIARLVAERRPSRLVACWDDDWRPAFRVAAIPGYKAHRMSDDGGEEVPAALVAQIPVIVEALEALGIARVGVPGYEADDVIGAYAAREARRPAPDRVPVEVVTGDRDLFQLVDDDAGTRVLYIGRGVANLEVVDRAWLADRYQVASGAAYADLAVLRGDPSDGLPGVAGIGEKTAAALLARYGDLPGVLDAHERGDPGITAAQHRRLAEAREYLAVAPQVVRVAVDAPVPVVVGTVPPTIDVERVAALAERWGLASSITRVVTVLTA